MFSLEMCPPLLVSKRTTLQQGLSHTWGWLGSALLLRCHRDRKIHLGAQLEGQSSSGVSALRKALGNLGVNIHQISETFPAQSLCPQQEGQQWEAGITLT